MVVLSELLARRRWPNEDPIGKPWKDGKNTVIGVVGNTRAMELNNTDATEIYYAAAAERSRSSGAMRADVNVGDKPLKVMLIELKKAK